MSDLTDRLEQKTRKEIRYARGMEVMQRERYVEYCRDLRLARQRGDARRTREIIQDLSAFVGEMANLMDAHQRALARLFVVRYGRELPPRRRGESLLPPTLPVSRDLAEDDDAAAGLTGADRLTTGLEAVGHPFPIADGDDHRE